MAFRDYLLLILITISIGKSSALTWNPSIQRYESYDLNKGPVFYEAYYPDNNEENLANYQEKRYFDRGAVLEKTYQIPRDRITEDRTSPGLNNYHNQETFQYPDGYVDPRTIASNDRRNVPLDYNGRSNIEAAENHFSSQLSKKELDIKEISNIARTAISRDLENWNALENYLDRAKYQASPYRQTFEPYDTVEQLNKGGSSRNTLKEPDRRTRLYEGDFLNLHNQIREGEDTRNSNVVRRLAQRDLGSSRSLRNYEPIRYQQISEEIAKDRTREIGQIDNLRREDALKEAAVDSFPAENIFAPRPQVINYVFSKKRVPEETKVQTSESGETTTDPLPRNYGDNLIRDEMKKTKDVKDVKVTSIEVSEVPRHKTRHHHGEWPKRDYLHRHQS